MTNFTPVRSPEHAEIAAALADAGLLNPGEKITVAALAGGVSCDVYRVDTGTRTLCVKRALPKLRVKADWYAPANRSHSEVEWISLVASFDSRLVPRVVGEDRNRHLFFMKFYPPDKYPVWKELLAAGYVDIAFAKRLGEALARIHGVTAGHANIARKFSNLSLFRALRLEPYLLYTAEKHADVSHRIREISDMVAGARIALMHGDFSPKNILCGLDGPLILDAETACYGDPAFDLAFCLNHLALKCVWHPEYSERYLQAFVAFKNAYLAKVDWEAGDVLDRRCAPLLAALLLARIDGKSPVEYLRSERDKDLVRRASKDILQRGETLDMALSIWRAKLASSQAARRGKKWRSGTGENRSKQSTRSTTRKD